jgi:acyl-coenzyme A thioesterase PaaI-like protein
MKGIDTLSTLTSRAKGSSFWLWLLNRALGWTIPFNRPHGFNLIEIGDEVIRTTAPYKRANYNHVKGIHACAIATVAEFSAGFLLLTKLDPKRYRLIMSRIEVEYLYQAKEQIVSESSILPEELEEKIYKPLQEQEAITIALKSRVSDLSGNEIAVAFTTWQVKPWDQVQTKL